jgi:hypothetical protein
MPEPSTEPARRRLECDLRSADFDSGVDAGLWRLSVLQWPYLKVAVTAGDGRELGMRIAVDDYPTRAPAGQLWDLGLDAPLPVSRWPTGGSSGLVFRRDWPSVSSPAPYMACDRVGLTAHGNWATEHPTRAWNPRRTITFYLREIHHELRSTALPPEPGTNA